MSELAGAAPVMGKGPMTATWQSAPAQPVPATRVGIRALSLADAPALTGLYMANRAYLRPWEPERCEEYFTLEGQRRNLDDLLTAAHEGELWPGAILLDGHLVGRITLNNILRGPLQSCLVGYWVAQTHAGRGVATEAVQQALDVAFHGFRLHRVEAYTRVDNLASQRVLHRNGFVRVGMARRHIHVDGRWHDESLFERLAPWDDGVALGPG